VRLTELCCRTEHFTTDIRRESLSPLVSSARPRRVYVLLSGSITAGSIGIRQAQRRSKRAIAEGATFLRQCSEKQYRYHGQHKSSETPDSRGPHGSLPEISLRLASGRPSRPFDNAQPGSELLAVEERDAAVRPGVGFGERVGVAGGREIVCPEQTRTGAVPELRQPGREPLLAVGCGPTPRACRRRARESRTAGRGPPNPPRGPAGSRRRCRRRARTTPRGRRRHGCGPARIRGRRARPPRSAPGTSRRLQIAAGVGHVVDPEGHTPTTRPISVSILNPELLWHPPPDQVRRLL